ncbi:DUF2489 domain-containing protein [Planctobacterium marinum]|uniref:DUF2489 domain-containing protein n=1 Tax=Planctobacterium marinum TaxID=1631968 RepID=UPI001E2EFF69|nr:DUF2489 domain-containing protein [Planctobacterium marinum]MCC2607222.1 DUF2489 domain-containing protein [Planctobacterium marinum]
MTFVAEHFYLLVTLAFIVVAGLSGYAVYLLMALRRQTREKQRKIEQREQDIITSIITIIQATLQQQCGISEAVLRVINLCDLLDNEKYPLDGQLPETRGFFEKIRHHPILDARKQLPKKTLQQLDIEREELEAQFESKIVKELQLLVTLLQPK